MSIKTLYRNLSIRSKLLLVFYIQVVIPMILIGLFFNAKLNDAMADHAVTLSLDALKIIKGRTEDFMDNIKIISQDLLYDQEIYNVLKDNRVDKFNYYNHVNELKNILRKRALAFDSIQSITIVTKDANFLSYDTNSGRSNIESIIPYTSLLSLARDAKGGAIWYIDEVGETRNVYLARIINDRDTYNEIGLLAILIDERELKNTYNQLSSDILNDIAIITPSNSIVFTDQTDLNWIENLDLDFKEDFGTITEKNSSRIISYIKLDHVDWSIVTSFSKDALLTDLNPMKGWIVKIFIPAILLLSIVTIFTAMDIVNPIKAIASHMRAFKEGRYEAPLALNREDELGYLANQLDVMITETDHLMNTVMNEQILRREVQIKALQAQINPHFLFNTLETINWRAQLINAPDISEMVTALSGVLEANISRDIKLISLKDELNYVKNYLSIMMRRYEDRLKIKWELEETLLSFKVPQLLLQPIVENAIKHGVGETTRYGVILIKVYIVENDIQIEVIDNGKGLKEEECMCLNRRFLEPINKISLLKDEENSSIGLDNVNQRIKLHYGDKFGLEVISKFEYYTKVILRLPRDGMWPNGF